MTEPLKFSRRLAVLPLFLLMAGCDMVVDANSKVELRRVEVSRSSRGQAVVAKGLKEGENVITEGVGKVRPGITVDAVTATTTGG